MKMYNLQEEQKIEGHIKGYTGDGVSIMQQAEMLQDTQLSFSKFGGPAQITLLFYYKIKHVIL